MTLDSNKASQRGTGRLLHMGTRRAPNDHPFATQTVRNIDGSFCGLRIIFGTGGDARPQVNARVSCGAGAKEPETGAAGAGRSRAAARPRGTATCKQTMVVSKVRRGYYAALATFTCLL